MKCVLHIETSDPDRRREAAALARKLSLPVAGTDRNGEDDDDDDDDVDSSSMNEPLTLAMRDDGLELRDGSMKPGRGLRIDFTHMAKRGRGSANLSRRQPLARAIGQNTRTVLDATAGLGQDAALLAAIGFHVTACERNAILAAMLQEALERAVRHEPTRTLLDERLRFIHADALDELKNREGSLDCIYLDPMFPPKRKASALAKKEIRLVRALVGDDPDAASLLEAARAACRRVVVKRPAWAAPLAAAQDVTASFGSKLVRYDVYVRERQPNADRGAAVVRF